MTFKLWLNLTRYEQRDLATRITKTIKQFVSEGNSPSLSMRLAEKKHKVSGKVITECKRLLGLSFKSQQGRRAKWLEVDYVS